MRKFHEALVTRGVWTAGWNIPGYLPDEPAEVYESWDDARQYLDNELERAGDDFAHDDGEQTIVDQYAIARQLLDQSEPDQAFYARVGNYVWWIERIIHPDES